MKRFAPFAAFVLGLAIVAWLLDRNVPHNPEPASTREMIDNPDYYHGRRVTVRLSGFQPGEKPGEYGWRPFSTRPFSLVVHMAEPRGRMPPAVTGEFRAGSPHRVVNCRPSSR